MTCWFLLSSTSVEIPSSCSKMANNLGDTFCRTFCIPRKSVHLFTARCYAGELGYAAVSRLSLCPSVCPSVRPSVTLGEDFHTCWNTSKIISRLNNLRHLLTFNPIMGDLVQRKHPQKGWNRGGVVSAKACNISETVQDTTKVAMTD